MKEKAAVTLYSVKDLKNFFAYYSLGNDTYQWTAIISENDELRELCKKTNVFEKIVTDHIRYDSMSLRKKINVFLRMFIAWIGRTAQKWRNARVAEVIPWKEYALIVVGSGEGGILNGALMSLSDCRKVVILEDGLGDYLTRKDTRSLLQNPIGMAAFLLAKMNYVDFSGQFHLKSALLCEKYVSYPERIEQKYYHKVLNLYDKKEFNADIYEELLQKTFEINYKGIKGDVLLLTMPIQELGAAAKEYQDKIEKYIFDNYKNEKILIKKHPRDITEYSFEACANVEYISTNIPGELIADNIECKDVLMMRPGNMSLCFDTYKILYCPEFDEVIMNNRGKKWGQMFRDLCELTQVQNENLITIQ